MPIPKPRSSESKREFIRRFMGNPTMVKEYPVSQRRAIAESEWKAYLKRKRKRG